VMHDPTEPIIPNVILLFSPGAGHESALVDHEPHGQRREVQSRTSTTLFWTRTREKFYQGRVAALERAREWVVLQVAAPTGGLAECGCVSWRDLVATRQVPGITPDEDGGRWRHGFGYLGYRGYWTGSGNGTSCSTGRWPVLLPMARRLTCWWNVVPTLCGSVTGGGLAPPAPLP